MAHVVVVHLSKYILNEHSRERTRRANRERQRIYQTQTFESLQSARGQIKTSQRKKILFHIYPFSYPYDVCIWSASGIRFHHMFKREYYEQGIFCNIFITSLFCITHMLRAKPKSISRSQTTHARSAHMISIVYICTIDDGDEK